ncbi:MAG: DoxX family protein [Pseudomonadota bacterium]
MMKFKGYYITTGLVSLMALGGALQYLTMQERIVVAFSNEMTGGLNAIGFPAWLIIPMGIMKILGVIALWAPMIPKWLREWAYAGLFFNFLLAIGAHVFNPINPSDSDWPGATAALVLLCLSRFFLYKKEGRMVQ